MCVSVMEMGVVIILRWYVTRDTVSYGNDATMAPAIALATNKNTRIPRMLIFKEI